VSFAGDGRADSAEPGWRSGHSLPHELPVGTTLIVSSPSLPTPYPAWSAPSRPSDTFGQLVHWHPHIHALVSKVVRIEPNLGDLKWAEGAYPTPHGIIKVRHEKGPDGKVKSTVHAPDAIKIILIEKNH
jgi:hypothetical protein